MPTPAIVRGSEHVSTVLYEGNGEGQRVGNFIPFTDNGSIAKSCLFDDGSSPYLNKTTGTATSEKKFTFSAWVKLASGSLGSSQYNLYQSGNIASSSDCFILNFNNTKFQMTTTGSTDMNLITDRSFDDTSKWYHIVVSADTTQSTASDRIKFYIDGDQITTFSTGSYPAQDYTFDVSSQNALIGAYNTGSLAGYFDGYLAEVNYADGQSYGPDTFGITDTSTGRWIPKSLGSITYGNNGFRMQFANTAGQTIGDDTSGNTNDFTVNNIATTDITTDSPTSNFTNMNGDKTDGTISEGGLKTVVPGSGAYEQIVALESFGVATGKWYWEVRVDSKGKSGLGWKSDSSNGGSQAKDSGGNLGTVYNVGASGGFADGEWTDDYTSATSNFSTFTTASNGDIVQFALDLDNRKGYVGINNTYFNSANPSNGTGSIGLGKDTIHAVTSKFYPMCLRLDSSGTFSWNFGQNPSFNGNITAGTATASSGPGLFKYTPPTDFLALCQDNLPTPDKDISDFVWIKSRDTASAHMLFDSSRGSQLRIKSDSTSSETTSQGTVTKFLKGGFAVGDQTSVNKASDSTVAWMWHANGGTTATNNDGSQTSTTQVNTTSGFSIVTYAGTSSGTATIGHGLSSTPEWIVIKNLTDSRSWFVYHKDLSGANYYLNLNSTSAQAVGDVFNNTAPTSSVFSIQDAGSLNTNGSGKNYLALCWHGVEGYSKFGSYKGNGSSNGTFINLGFKPAVIITKNISGSYRWNIIDNKRDPFNPAGRWLAPDNTDDEDAYTGSYPHDFLSNGFKLRANTTVLNNNNNTFVYAAFAEHPFIGDGTNPCTAR